MNASQTPDPTTTYERRGPLKRAFHFIVTQPKDFLKLILPLLLVVSFSTVLHGWFSLMDSTGVSVPIRDILTVPLMLFGVTAILCVMVFGESGPSVFLAVFIIGTVVAGAEVVKIGAELATKPFNQGAALYEGGNVGTQTSSYTGTTGGLKKPIEAESTVAPEKKEEETAGEQNQENEESVEATNSDDGQALDSF